MTTPNLELQSQSDPLLTNLESQSQQIQPTNPPIVSPTEDNSLNPVLLESLRDANRRLADQERQLAELKRPVAPVDLRSDEERRAAWFNDPEGTQRQLVRQEVEATIKPLMEFVTGLKSTGIVDRAISNIKSDPRLSQQFDSDVENYVRAELAKLDPNQINDGLTGAIALGAIGMKATGMIKSTQAPASINNPSPTPNMSPITPPHIRADPLPINAPVNQPTRTTRQLTEDEVRILRETNSRRSRKITEQEYIDLTDLPAGQVATSKIGV